MLRRRKHTWWRAQAHATVPVPAWHRLPAGGGAGIEAQSKPGIEGQVMSQDPHSYAWACREACLAAGPPGAAVHHLPSRQRIL